MDDFIRYYRSIPLVPKDTEPVDPSHAHWHYADTLLSGQIQGSFIARQPLHVGTGQFVPPERLSSTDEAPLVKSFYRLDETIIVPGSSFKGAVRHIVEAITYSAVSKTRTRLDRDRYGESSYNSRRGQGRLDLAGRLFGAMGYLGHVKFTDAPLVEGEMTVLDIPPQYQPRAGDGRRYYPHQLKDPRDPLWPLEVAAVGSRFKFTIQFDNCTYGELGVILIALGQTDPPICLKLGAGKNSGLGAIQFTDVLVERVDSEASYSSLDTTWQSVDIAQCLTHAQEEWIRRDDALSRLQTDLGCATLDQ